MTTPAKTCPSEVCEAVLRERIAQRRERGILPHQIRIAERLLDRRIELRSAYAELCRKLDPRGHALPVFFDLLLGVADLWAPECNARARDDRKTIEAVNRDIARLAFELAKKLQTRDRLNNTSGFFSDTHYHPLDLIAAASRGNFLHESYVKQPLQELGGRYDLKYWPSLQDCIHALGDDAQHAAVDASDPVTAAATKGLRNSTASFFHALFKAIESNTARNRGFLPDDFRLTDGSLAALANSALDLSPEQILDQGYVKRLRQRDRDQASDAD